MQHANRGSRRLLAFFSSSALILIVGAVFSATASAHAFAKPGNKHHWSGGGGSITSQPWGSADNAPVSLYTLTNGHHMTVTITNYGGDVTSIAVPDRSGGTKDVSLGFPTLADYVADFTQGATQTPWPLSGGSGDTYFGAIIGRYGNRIANHTFTITGCSNNGTKYTLDANNGVNTLHGGYLGWNTQVWNATPETGSGYVALQLQDTFPSGEGCLTLSPGCNGFPANVTATVTYYLTRDNTLKITYSVVNDSSTLATVLNVTNHTYFNLGGEGSGSVYGQDLAINSDTYQPVDVNQIPTNFASVAGTAYDFRTLHPIGEFIRRADLPDGGTQAFPQLVISHGYDNNWVLNGSGYRLAAIAADRKTGITLAAYTDQPGVQFYSGNFLVGDLTGPSGHIYRQGAGFTLETQHYPDAPNHIGQAGWPSVVLNPSSTFNSTTAFKFGTAGGGSAGHRRF